jgi:cysteinyl-tRNA synthetase
MGFFRKFTSIVGGRVPLRLYNTLTQHEDVFQLPAGVKKVRMYNCGPTVYDTSHIGNLRSYVFADTVRRALEYNDFEVKQVINITDFGHLSSDADAGPDKMTNALKREGLALSMENMRILAEKYTEQFISDLRALNIDAARITFPRASEHIKGEIALIHTLEEKAYTYRGVDGVYFDTSRFPHYGQLGNVDIIGLKAGARVAASDDKRSPTDFLLWKSDAHLGWDSPWGKGFPGWHIECSAMINATLGKQIDIHTGGIDLMPTHHNNEIAQSEAATGKHPLSRFWLHHEFLNIHKEKISKSVGNMVHLSELTARGIHPLAYRYFLLGAHYRTAMNFSWEGLQAAQNALNNLYEVSSQLGGDGHDSASAYRRRFTERINDDLDTPGALAVMWEMLRDDMVEVGSKKEAVRTFDTVLGLDIPKYLDRTREIPSEIQRLVQEREQARAAQKWDEADRLRAEIEARGYSVKDTEKGPAVNQQVRN